MLLWAFMSCHWPALRTLPASPTSCAPVSLLMRVTWYARTLAACVERARSVERDARTAGEACLFGAPGVRIIIILHKTCSR